MEASPASARGRPVSGPVVVIFGGQTSMDKLWVSGAQEREENGQDQRESIAYNSPGLPDG
jgi:hypothetical protein